MLTNTMQARDLQCPVVSVFNYIDEFIINDRSCTCVVVDCSLADPPPPAASVAVAVEWSSQKSDEDSSERGRECRDRWPVGLQNSLLIMLLKQIM